MKSCDNLLAIISELADDARQVDGDAVTRLGEMILTAERIFVAGAGRSGFAARAFSNRLMHLGFSVWFVGLGKWITKQSALFSHHPKGRAGAAAGR